MAKKGHNSTLGRVPEYIEDPVEDKVTFQKNVKKPIWRDPKHITTTAWNPQFSTFSNTSGVLK